MKFFKTPTSSRSIYTYEFINDDGESKKIVIKPNENGVTEADIKLLHTLDDRVVEQNNRQHKVPFSFKEKAEQEAWKEQYCRDFEQKNGYIPCKKDVEYAVSQRFPKKYLASIELETELRGDKSEVLAVVEDNSDEYAEAIKAHIAEFLKSLSDFELIIYNRALLKRESHISIAKDLGVSDSWVGKIAKRIEARIESDKFLRKFFVFSPDPEDSAAYDTRRYES